jgi:hypothetical protein
VARKRGIKRSENREQKNIKKIQGVISYQKTLLSKNNFSLDTLKLLKWFKMQRKEKIQQKRFSNEMNHKKFLLF